MLGSAPGPDDLKKGGENIVVGGANRWNYKSFVNWAVAPPSTEHNALHPFDASVTRPSLKHENKRIIWPK